MRALRLSDRSLLLQEQADDPEYGEWVAAQPEGPPPAPPLSEWTPDHAELVAIKDRVGELIAAVIGSAGGQMKPPPPSRRPVTAADRARAAAARRQHESLVAEVREAQERWSAAQHNN